MSSRILLATLVVLWFVGVPRGLGADAERVRFADDFATNTLKDYEIKGDVTWQKGQVTLGKNAQLTRKVAVGHTAEVRAVIRLPADKGPYELRLRFQGEKVYSEIGLVRTEGKTVLVNLKEPVDRIELAVGDPGGRPAEEVWEARFEVRYGLARAKAWRRGAAEPKDWQTTRYSGETMWEPQTTSISAGKTLGASLNSWAITGVAPALVLPEVKRQALQEAASLSREVFRLWQAGKSRDALPLAQRALKICQDILGENHPDTALQLSNLGAQYEAILDFGSAHLCYERVLAISKKVLGPEHPDTATSLNTLGFLLWAQREYAAARPYIERALAICKKALGLEHPHTAASLNNLGALLAADNDGRGAWRALVASVASYSRLTDRLLAASAERQHTDIMRKRRYTSQMLLSLAEAASQMTAERRNELLAAVLDWKASSGQALLARHEAFLAAQAPDVAPLLGEVRQARQRLVNALLRGPGRRSTDEHQADLQRLRQEQDKLERDLAGKVDGLAILHKARQANPDLLAQRLKRGSVLVELVKYDRYDFHARDHLKWWQPPRYAALLLEPAAAADGLPDIRLVFLGEAAPIDRALHAWRAAAQSGPIDPAVERTLRERLWQPLANALPAGTKRLFVAPDGELALLPFEAIHLEDGRYLVEQFQVSYLSSGRDLMPRPALKDPPGPALVLADPDYDAVGDTSAPAPGPLLAQAGAKRSGDLEKRGIRFNRLPGFAGEADAVLQAWQAARPGERIERVQGRDASEEKLAAAARPRLLYLITHGFFLPDLELLPADRDRLMRDFEIVPLGGNRLPRLPGSGDDPLLRSGLALAGANRWQQRAERGQSDGLLTALEVLNLDLWGTELVVLSACETGVGEVSNIGEGVLGLRRAFQGAGARTVLASLWKVPDKDTERLMTKFFARWLKGTPKAQALREAQLELLAELRKDADPKRRAAPPLLWAGFICHGQPD